MFSYKGVLFSPVHLMFLQKERNVCLLYRVKTDYGKLVSCFQSKKLGPRRKTVCGFYLLLCSTYPGKYLNSTFIQSSLQQTA